MIDALSTHGLTKEFGGFRAVDRLSLAVREGEIYGFLGLNGAGKTTTIRMLLGMIRPTSGTACLRGDAVDAGRVDLWERVGYLVESPSAYPDLTVAENLGIVASLRRLPRPRKAVGRIAERLGLSPYADRKARHLSLGNFQRLGLAKAMIHDPDILILDEPTNGLDPAGIVEIRSLLRELSGNRGTTIFVSSHLLGEVARIATRIGILHRGRLLEERDASALERSRKRSLRVDAADRPRLRAFLADLVGPSDPDPNGSFSLTDARFADHPDDLARRMVENGVPPTLLMVEEEDLETHFLRRVRDADAAAAL